MNTAVPPGRGRVLIVDDSEIILSRDRLRLMSEGYEVRTTTQTVGIAKYLRGTDVVLLDFHMPGIDGVAVLRSLKAAADDAGLSPLFYLYTSDAVRAGEYAELGFDGVIRNKGDTESLVLQIEAAFRVFRTVALLRRTKRP